MYLTKFATKLYATNVRFIRWASLLQVSKWDSIFFQFSNGTIKTSRFRQFLWSQYELLLYHTKSCIVLLAWQVFEQLYSPDQTSGNVTAWYYFYLFFTYLIRLAPNARAPNCLGRFFHVNMGFTFSDDDRILTVTSNICCLKWRSKTCLIYTGWLSDIWILRLFVCVASFSLASHDVIA